LLWRSLVWAAAKPFPMRCIPPYVTARMDDCNGSYDAFGWVRALNRHGIRPNIGLFTDEMGPADWAGAKRLFDKGLADFSMHAFRDDFYKAMPSWKPWAEAPGKPDLSDGGKRTAFEGMSVDHETGRSLDGETVRRNFARMDAAFGKAGIRPGRILNSHFGEIGWQALKEYLRRGVDMPCNNSAPGQLYGNQPPWRPRPYAARGATGRYGLVIDYAPGCPQMVFVHASSSHAGKTHMTMDILSGRVPFIGEAETPRIAEASAQGVANVKLMLDMLAWGVIMTHEERIAVISPEDWVRCVDGVMAGLKGWDIVPAGREEVSVVARRLFETRLAWAESDGGRVSCGLAGRSDGPSPVTIWEDEGEGCVRRVAEAPAVEGYAEVRGV